MSLAITARPAPSAPAFFPGGVFVRRAALLLLLAEAAILAFLIAWTHGAVVRLAHPTSTDFVSFYAAGVLADAHLPAFAYNHAIHALAEQQATAYGAPYQFFFYPPTFLPICQILARLPYLPAFLLFQAVTLAAFLAAIRPVLAARGPWLIPVLAFPAVFWTIGLGQNAFLTAALLITAARLADRRPVLAGLAAAALCYKPHFALLIPVAFAAGGYWRAFVTAALATLAAIAATLLAYGPACWLAYLHVFAGSAAVYQSGRIDFAGIVTAFGAARLAGLAPGAAYAVQGVASLAAAAGVAWLWRRHAAPELRAAGLLAGTLLAVPLALLYDLMVLAGALAFLAALAARTGWRVGEKPAFLLAVTAALFGRYFAAPTHASLGFLSIVCVFALVLIRAAAPHTR